MSRQTVRELLAVLHHVDGAKGSPPGRLRGALAARRMGEDHIGRGGHPVLA